MMQKLLPHQLRVIDELTELSERLNKLVTFIGESSIYVALSKAERERLVRQCLIMQLYQQVLQERTEAFSE